MREVNYTITSLLGWGNTNQKLGKESIKGPNCLLQTMDNYKNCENSNNVEM